MTVDGNNDILTIEQAAQLLKVGNRTIYNLLSDERRPDKIFARKVGRSWRILRSEVERFLTEEPRGAYQMKISQNIKK